MAYGEGFPTLTHRTALHVCGCYEYKGMFINDKSIMPFSLDISKETILSSWDSFTPSVPCWPRRTGSIAPCGGQRRHHAAAVQGWGFSVRGKTLAKQQLQFCTERGTQRGMQTGSLETERREWEVCTTLIAGKAAAPVGWGDRVPVGLLVRCPVDAAEKH